MARLASVSIAMSSRASERTGTGSSVAGLHAAGQPLLEDAPPVALDQVLPGVGAQHARAVHQDDPLEVAADTDVEERAHPFPYLREGRLRVRGQLLVDQPRRDVPGGLRHDRAEQVGLVAEMVVQRARG